MLFVLIIITVPTFVFADYVQPICLVDNSLRLGVGNDVFVAGWGKTESGMLPVIDFTHNLLVFLGKLLHLWYNKCLRTYLREHINETNQKTKLDCLYFERN